MAVLKRYVDSEFLRKWLAVEEPYSQPTDVESAVHFARFQKRASHPPPRLCFRQIVTWLHSAKTFLSGDPSRENENQNVQESKDLLKHSRLEVLLKQARIEALKGEWATCRDLCREALTFDPDSDALGSILQIRSVALYELGEFELAREDLIRIDFLMDGSLTAHWLFSKSLDIKLTSRLEGAQAASQKLDRLWIKATVQNLSGEAILSLLRTELDLHYVQKKASLPLAWAVFSSAENAQDLTQKALAALDVYSHTRDPRFLYEIENSNRAMKVLLEMESDQGFKSTTAKTLSQIEVHHTSGLKRPPDFLILRRLGLLVNLKKCQISKITTQQSELLLLLQEPLPRYEIFCRIYGLKKYVPYLHDSALEQLLLRLLALGLQIEFHEDRVQLTSSVIWS